MRSTDDIHKAASAAARKSQVTASLGAFGTEDVYTAPPQTNSLSLRQQKNGRDVFAKTKPSPSTSSPRRPQSSLKKMVEKC